MQNSTLQTFLSRKGQIVSLDTHKTLKLRKEHKGSILLKKVSGMQARAGVDYSHIKDVREQEREVQPLPWGEWEIFPHVIKHKGQRYFRLSSLNGGQKGKVEYYLDGKLVTEEEAKAIALASEFKSKDEKLIVFNLKEENIDSIR